MNTLSAEPYIKVGIIANDDARLIPLGNWEITQSNEGTFYNPLDSEAYMEVEGVIFGKNFHWESSQTCRYRGRFKFLNEPTHDGFKIINELPIEQYVESVVASEMNPEAPEEFIRAHATISRTWALRKIIGSTPNNRGKIKSEKEISTWQESDLHSDFNVCSDDHCQRYQGISELEETISTILKPTNGQILINCVDDKPADTRFSKCCGGETEVFSTCWANEDYPYLIHRKDPYCNPKSLPTERFLSSILKDYDQNIEYFIWETKVARKLIRENLFKLYSINIGDIKEIVSLEKGSSGRIKKLLVKGTEGEIIIGKELSIRRLLSDSHLYSSAFEIVNSDKDYFYLKGKGWGHGVGLCQIGAAVMAAKGHKAKDILSFYFPNTRLEKIY